MSDMSIAQASALLGVSDTASAEELRIARRALVRANHPDLLARHERAKADRRLSDINTAFDLLIRRASTRNPERNAEDFVSEHRASTAAEQTQTRPHTQTQTQAKRRAEAEPVQTSAPTPNATATPAPSTAAAHATPKAVALPTPAPRAPLNHQQRNAKQAYDTALSAVSTPRQAPTRTEYA